MSFLLLLGFCPVVLSHLLESQSGPGLPYGTNRWLQIQSNSIDGETKAVLSLTKRRVW